MSRSACALQARVVAAQLNAIALRLRALLFTLSAPPWPGRGVPWDIYFGRNGFLECAIAALAIFRVALEIGRWPNRPSMGVRVPSIFGRRFTRIRKGSRRISRKVTA